MNARLPATFDRPLATWPAQLRVHLAQRPELGTRLIECSHSGPLRLQRPFYPEGADCAHLYLLHPPGGLVSGDALGIEISVGAGAGGLVTTPGAGRIYRARRAYQPARQLQRVALAVAAGGTLEWLPQPTIVFDGADVVLEVAVELAADAAFAGWEVLCLGRPASRLPFEQGVVEQRWQVVRGGRPLFNDRLRIEGGDVLRAARWGLQGQPVYGTLLAVPAAGRAIPAEVIDALRSWADARDAVRELAVTRLREAVVVRYLGASTERAQTYFEHCWSQLRPHLTGRGPVRPRIWNT